MGLDVLSSTGVGLQLNQTFTGGSGILSCLCIGILLLLCLQTGPAGISLLFCYCSERLRVHSLCATACVQLCVQFMHVLSCLSGPCSLRDSKTFLSFFCFLCPLFLFPSSLNLSQSQGARLV